MSQKLMVIQILSLSRNLRNSKGCTKQTRLATVGSLFAQEKTRQIKGAPKVGSIPKYQTICTMILPKKANLFTKVKHATLALDDLSNQARIYTYTYPNRAGSVLNFSRPGVKYTQEVLIEFFAG